jgi:hypothetical protein
LRRKIQERPSCVRVTEGWALRGWKLEAIFQCELYLARSLRSENLTVVRCACGVLATEFLPEVEDRGVRKVGHIHPEFECLPLGDGERFGKTDGTQDWKRDKTSRQASPGRRPSTRSANSRPADLNISSSCTAPAASKTVPPQTCDSRSLHICQRLRCSRKLTSLEQDSFGGSYRWCLLGPRFVAR